MFWTWRISEDPEWCRTFQAPTPTASRKKKKERDLIGEWEGATQAVVVSQREVKKLRKSAVVENWEATVLGGSGERSMEFFILASRTPNSKILLFLKFIFKPEINWKHSNILMRFYKLSRLQSSKKMASSTNHFRFLKYKFIIYHYMYTNFHKTNW